MDRKSGGGSRRKNVTGEASGGGIFRRGSGLNQDKQVGNASGYEDRKQGGSGTIGEDRSSGSFGGGPSARGFSPIFGRPSGTSGTSGTGGARGAGGGRARGGCGSSVVKLILILVLLYAAYQAFSNNTGLFDGPGAEEEPAQSAIQQAADPEPTVYVPSEGSAANNAITPATGIKGPRTRRTSIKGNGQDVFTIMVYMCGTDLESDYGMATADLNEMLYATISSKVNIIVETGGTAKWNNNVIKSSTNQRYKVNSNGLKLLQGNLGRKPMTDPETLQSFISYCAKNYPADRYALIMWDHGGGSLSGYGYDQVFPNSGSMSISEMNSALTGAGVAFDFIGFDACLMATLETAYMLNYHADYMIASEETEPSIGWYYTDWITALSRNTSMDTVEIGRMIVDDFIEKCGSEVPRETTTLSVVDLVALNNLADGSFKAFAKSAEAKLDSDFKVISNARGGAREFNKAKLDQVDLIDLAGNINSPEAKALVKALKQCISYNRTSRNISKANGISIYFPYDELRNVSSMLSIYGKVGMGSEYNSLIRKFANMVVGGRITTSGSDSPMPSLFGTQASGSGSSSDPWSQAWNSFFENQDFSAFLGSLSQGQSSWIDSDQIQSASGFFKDNYLDSKSLKLVKRGGKHVLNLTDKQWDLVQGIELNVFFDDGEGYIDLGLDNVYEFNSDGDLIVDFDGTWLALDGHVVAYYVESVEQIDGSWSTTGRIPAMLNDRRVEIMVAFNDDYPDGIVQGARIDYEGATDTVAKGLIEIKEGDVIDFLCDYYTYDEDFQDSYYLGDSMEVTGDMAVSNVNVGDARCLVTYRLTDIYNNTYWTPALKF